MRCRPLGIFALALALGNVTATGAQQAYEEYTLPGWASRLRIPLETPSGLRPKAKVAGVSKLGEDGGSSPLLLLTKYAASKAYDWLFRETHDVVEVVEEFVEKTTVWKDTAPRFIVFGDEYGRNTSLGIPDPVTLRGVTHFLIPFWTTKEGITESMLQWTHSTAAERKAIVREYNDHGIRLGVSSFFADTGRPKAMARRMASFAKKYHFQGVNVDFKDYELFEHGNASAWLVPLARRMRTDLPSEDGFFISHAPIAPLFNGDKYTESYSKVEEKVGKAIDFYSVQFDGSSAYSTCKSLIHEANEPFPQTALLQLNSSWQVPLDKLVISKPSAIHDIRPYAGGMNDDTFARCLGEAFAEGWKGGVSWKQVDGTSVETILQPILDQVRHYPHHRASTKHLHATSPKHRIARHAARAKKSKHL